MKNLILRLLAVIGLVFALLLGGCDSEKPDPTTASTTKAVVEQSEPEPDENEGVYEDNDNEPTVPTEPEDNVSDSDDEEDIPLLDGEISEDTDDWGELH